MKRSNDFFLRGPLLPAILRYTIPIVLTGALQLLFNAADLVVVGRYCGEDCVGAVGSTGSTTSLIVTLFMGLSVGGGVCTAHALGAGDDQAVHRAVHTAIPTALISGVILTVVGMFVSEPLLKLMGTPAELLPLSKLYMQIYFGGISFIMLYNFAGAILRSAGDTRSPLIYLCFSGVANVVLNVIFVTAFGMDVDGVALATVLSQGISAVLCVRNLMRRKDACRLQWKKVRIYKPELLKMMRIGFPAGIQNAMFSISNITIQSAINSFGRDFVNGNSAAANVEGFMWVFANAFQQASINFVGQNHGAKQTKRATQSLWLCLGGVVVICATIGLIGYTFAEQLLSIYLPDAPQAIAYGLVRAAWVFPVYFLFGLMESTTGALRGRGASFAPMLISIIGICGIRLGWIFTVFQIPKYHTPEGLYFSFPLSWAVTFCCLLAAYLVIVRRERKSQGKELAATH